MREVRLKTAERGCRWATKIKRRQQKSNEDNKALKRTQRSRSSQGDAQVQNMGRKTIIASFIFGATSVVSRLSQAALYGLLRILLLIKSLEYFW